MSTRRITGRNSALALMALTAAVQATDFDRFRLPSEDEQRPIFMNANPRHNHNRGKRGGNGKGRQWWNK